MATDPVCWMWVDHALSSPHSDYEHVVYAFCSEECKRAFDADPGRYARASCPQSARTPVRAAVTADTRHAAD